MISLFTTERLLGRHRRVCSPATGMRHRERASVLPAQTGCLPRPRRKFLIVRNFAGEPQTVFVKAANAFVVKAMDCCAPMSAPFSAAAAHLNDAARIPSNRFAPSNSRMIAQDRTTYLTAEAGQKMPEVTSAHESRSSPHNVGMT